MNNRSQTQRFPLWAGLFLALTFAVLAIGFFEAMTAPKEATMGNLYRVFFYHFPHTILSFVFPYMNCVAAFLFLYWRRTNIPKALAADAFALASAEVTVLYASVGLATGMLWARAAWGIWWTWDARLTTYLLLWLLYVSYLLLRRLTTGDQKAVFSAVLAIFAAIDIPICFMSIRWWRTQHPAPVFGGGEDSGIDPHMLPAVLWNLVAWAMWGAFVLGLRYAIERRRQRIAAETAPRMAPRQPQFWRFDDSLFNALGTALGLRLLRGVDFAVWLRHVAGDSVAAYAQKNNGAKRAALIRWSEESLSTGRSAWLPRQWNEPGFSKSVAENFLPRCDGAT